MSEYSVSIKPTSAIVWNVAFEKGIGRDEVDSFDDMDRNVETVGLGTVGGFHSGVY